MSVAHSGHASAQGIRHAACDLAHITRCAYGSSDRYPVDVYGIAMRMHMEVHIIPLSDEPINLVHTTDTDRFIGAIITGEHCSSIYCDKSLPSEVGRFIIAHELGHYLLHGTAVNLDGIDTAPVSPGWGNADNLHLRSSHDPVEHFANAFACELLMPKDDLHVRVTAGDSDRDLAVRYRVPLVAAIGWRAISR